LQAASATHSRAPLREESPRESPGAQATASASGGQNAQAIASAGNTVTDRRGGPCPPQEEEAAGLADPNIPADVLTSQTMSAGPKVGGPLAWITITASNNGTHTATDAYVKDLMPAGFQFVDCTSTIDGLPGGWCWWDGTNIVVNDFGDFPKGSFAVTTIFVRPTVAGEFINTVGVGSDDYDPDSTNNFFDLPVTVGAA
jgi:uncharacterized repeat protein (TIGR01451 family)